ncbi:hypothetical protein BGX31_008521 [Mortierella sp. GBA43]|nr:hypothetical protein BGX31_008521 [Mortierella sp. GBA43]
MVCDDCSNYRGNLPQFGYPTFDTSCPKLQTDTRGIRSILSTTLTRPATELVDNV